MARDYFCAYHSFLESLTPLGDAERGRLFTACLMYSMTGETAELRGNERFIWPTLKNKIDEDNAAYQAKCEKLRANGSKCRQKHAIGSNCFEREAEEREKKSSPPVPPLKENPQEGEENTNTCKKTPRTRKAFVPPTLDEVREYVRQRNSPVDPEAFWEYFEEGGWKDSEGKPVLAWKQKLITWENHGNGVKKPVRPNRVTASCDFSGRDVSRLLAAMEEMA